MTPVAQAASPDSRDQSADVQHQKALSRRQISAPGSGQMRMTFGNAGSVPICLMFLQTD